MTAEDARPSAESRLVQIEPDERLIMLARTLQELGPGFEGAWHANADRTLFGGLCLGRALYRHRSVFQSASDAPAWSHLDLHYFRDVVPTDAIHDLVDHTLAESRLLRAELLLTTPSAFVTPLGWRGSADRPERRVSIEYIHVRPASLGAYRDVMRRLIGPAAMKLVAAGEVGTFRAMETAAVLYRAPSLEPDWNQIHLCEVEPSGFQGFGPAFDRVLRGGSPDGGFVAVFAGLAPMRTIPRWTFNDAVAEVDLAARGVPRRDLTGQDRVV